MTPERAGELVWAGDLSEPDQTYTTRGRISTIPTPDSPASELTITHEPLPEFVSRTGKVVGMGSHAMPFGAVAPGVLPAELRVGDVVVMTYEVRWESQPRTLIVAMKKLPADTELNLGR
ncbi:MAG TPA: hypothetical protein ENJ00_08675 [Phycisphaerales bacterium]|nr:hypothetical protein [Phycisphaerales bacterium]